MTLHQWLIILAIVLTLFAALCGALALSMHNDLALLLSLLCFFVGMASFEGAHLP